jgi:hypothetical protein
MNASEESNKGVVPTKLPNKSRGEVAKTEKTRFAEAGGGKAHDQGEHHGT